MQIGEGVETQVVVEAFLVVSVAPLDLSVVPRSSRANKFVLNPSAVAEHVKRMSAVGSYKMSELCAVVGLYGLRKITEEDGGTLHEVYG